MRIANIEVFNLLFHYPLAQRPRYAGGLSTARVTSIIRVTTDDGLVGWGSVYSHPDIVRIVVEQQLKPLLIGSDPTEVEALWQRMYLLTRWYGRKGAAMSAMGGLDTAFWDLRGKAAGQPIHKLLGAKREAVPAYASALLWQDDVDELGREAERHVANGFRRMKMRLGRSWRYDREAIAAALRGCAGKAELMVDGSMRYSEDQAARLGRVLADNEVFWFEEPFAPEDIDRYVTLRRRLTVPIAAGENEFGVQGFRELLRAGAVDIVQADASRCGGISEVLRTGRMAAGFGARLAPHSWSDAIAVIANAHVVAALDNGVTVEVDQTANPFIDRLLKSPLRVKDGLLPLPTGPGLGIEIDPAVLEEFAFPAGQPIPDGSYSDMNFGAGSFTPAGPYDET